jgi:DNA-binding transcriptional LysR family regulator
MNVDELRTFLEVVESRSLVAASRRLHVTQSTVTARLNALEREVGQKLLHRSKAGAELTSAGFKFERYAQVMLQLWRQARSEISLPKGFEGVCNVGLEFDLWRGVGERFLDHVRSNEPRIAVAMWPGEQPQIDRWLKIGLIDIAFCYTPLSGEDFASRVLLDDELMLVSSTARGGAPIDSGYVYVDHGEEFRRQHAASFPTEATAGITIASSDWALDHVLATGGSGYFSRRHVADLLRRRRLHVVRDAPRFRRRIHLIESAQVAQWPWYERAVGALAAHGTRLTARQDRAADKRRGPRAATRSITRQAAAVPAKVATPTPRKPNIS